MIKGDEFMGNIRLIDNLEFIKKDDQFLYKKKMICVQNIKQNSEGNYIGFCLEYDQESDRLGGKNKL